MLTGRMRSATTRHATCTGLGLKTLFPNAELNLLSPGSGCTLQAGTGHGRPGRAPGPAMLMRGDIFAASRGGGAGF